MSARTLPNATAFHPLSGVESGFYSRHCRRGSLAGGNRQGNHGIKSLKKTTQDGRENYLVSLHYMDARALRRFLRTARVIAGAVKRLLP